MSATALTPWTLCRSCTPDAEARLLESAARRQGREIVDEQCPRCTRTPGPKTAVDIVRATSDEMVRRGRAIDDPAVIPLSREFDSMTREGIVSVALLIAEDLLRERRRNG